MLGRCATAACTVAGLAMRQRFDLVNIAMIYLVAVVSIALRCSRGPSILTSILCVATFDYLFVPPQGTFSVDDAQYILTFVIMLAVALVISGLVESIRRQARPRPRLRSKRKRNASAVRSLPRYRMICAPRLR